MPILLASSCNRIRPKRMSTSKPFSTPRQSTISKQRPPFHLLRYFTIISLVGVVITSLVFGAWFSYISSEELIANEQRNNIALARTLSKWIWPQYGAFLSSAAKLGKQTLIHHPLTKQLDQAIMERTAELNIIKIKIYDLNGYTVFSTDPSQTGDMKLGQASFAAARNGTVVSKLAFRDKIYARTELIENRNILSSYMPIIYGKDGKIVAVLEIYKDVSLLIDDINLTQKRIILAVTSGLIILFAILFFLIRHADQIIRSYNKEQQNNTARIEHQAYHDALTGLPNRILFLNRLEHAMAHALTEHNLIAIMFIDLDRFKQINDSLGHETGDELLIEVARRIKACSRPADTVTRLAGDEFTVILEGLRTVDLAISFAQRIIHSLEKPVVIGTHQISCTCSIGIALYPFEDDTAQGLIQKADTAMYFTKQRGRNNFHFYTPGSDHIPDSQLALEKELILAIEKNQFELYFQPKINLDTMSMQGMEALLRWNHPHKGIIYPADFIPALEETGMINQVGQWVIEQACRQNRKWIDSGLPPLRVAVNVSNIQLNRGDFAETVFAILDKTGLEPKWLELELTESGLMADIDANIHMFNKLRNKGIKLALDDFGTGYSSLSYICKLPIDVIKIDKEFVQQISNDKQNQSIVTAILSFAHGLRLEIVAEGVELAEQVVFLQAMRCNMAQGYLFSHPLPADGFEKLCRSDKHLRQLATDIRQNAMTNE